MITIESISKSFGAQILFSNAGLQINPGEKVGLVGRNGHGKTTLLKMITHGEEPDSGQIQIPGDYRLGYLTQHIAFTGETVLEECMAGLPIHEKDHSWKAEKILAGLGFSDEEMQHRPDSFSGGYQVRLTLARVLVSDPDLLVLDEPTNYLDIISIRWLTSFLRAWPREILLVTHDRGFMDGIVTHIAGIHRGVIRKIQGNTEKYYEQIAQDEEIYEKTRVNEEKRRKEMETFITRFRAKARLAGMVQSRVKALSKMEKKEGLKKIESLSFSFRDLPFAGKQLLTGEGLTFSYETSTPLITDVNLMVHPGDRIAIVGKNGKGKTTLLKLLSGMLAPVAGGVKYNPGVEMGYFEQTNVQSLNLNATVEEEMLYAHEDMDRQQARNICGALMFEGDDALKHISVLSGGEKSRVMLGKLLAQPLNLLLLDEPTNHLDMETCDSLVMALEKFTGAVVLVTHNEMFLNSLANRLIVFKNDAIHVFEGTYRDFLEKEGWDEEKKSSMEGNTGDGAVEDEKKISKKALRKMRSEVVSRRSSALGPLEKSIAATEKNIEKCENELSQLNEQMQIAAENQEGKRIESLSRSIARCQEKIDKFFTQLECDMDELDEKGQIFEEQLAEIDGR
ncbi:ATP-binding cassette, subfamily F, member 3 [Desulfocicer vacuolatum DSM 3385]|uniref:ATP-binding cassette, subfamily F, member 3 n=1 Tax=Desulfocicer vacuolatum DSM 3385 TaxID=1121400 RepID=A0A1W1ZQB1_9BACT|nr:ABC-F family ATP-binding cassette domain-containing protein [Desulfocicer vacuolatum]SMC50730.1 ATP-binding cassette, subfamily F, member 3 [Desulfocicer vacuolatum DSM 3385]